MKNFTFVLAAFLLSSWTIDDSTIMAEDKAFLLDYFEETSQNLISVVKDLNPGQASFQPADDSWSIAQCLEHIILTEKTFFETVKETMAQPANPDKRSEIKASDQEIIQGMTDRSQKVKTSDNLQPTGSFGDLKATLKAFKKQRKQVRKYIKGFSEEELRNHVMDTFFGPLDVYQFMLMMAAHSSRHTIQAEEVIAHEDFPGE